MTSSPRGINSGDVRHEEPCGGNRHIRTTQTARLEKQREDLVGVVISQDNEPSHALVDKIFQQLDDGCVVWTPWEQLSSRAKETQSAKKNLTFRLDCAGNLTATQREELSEVSLSGDIRVRQALQRRAFAYDLSKMISYGVLEI